MKEGIHPDYKPTTIRCACGEVIETSSTKSDIKVEICSKCHPFYTGSKSWSIRRARGSFQQEVWLEVNVNKKPPVPVVFLQACLRESFVSFARREAGKSPASFQNKRP